MSETFKNFRYALVGMLLLFCAAVQAQTISGNVKDAAGEPIIGATVMEQGTQNGTVTDFDGNFTLKLQKGGNLNISYVGMKSQVIKTAGKSSVNITLEDDNTTLNDLVVVGYGTMKKSDLTGSVSSVNTEQLNAKGQGSVLGNLQGATPGVNITMSGGRTGGTPTIKIRGKSSINSDVTPLYVVDGVMCDDIDWLNPQDIEKIDVLKDASSTAIYGSRATAGVVMVTTKGGGNVAKDKKATISYDGYIGFTKVARMPDFMNSEQYARYRFLECLSPFTEGIGNPSYYITKDNAEFAYLKKADGSYVVKDRIANGVNTDWPGLVTQNGVQTNHYVAVSGGSSAVSYHLGAGYHKRDGVYEGDSYQRYNFKSSIDAKITNWLNAGFNINFGEQNNKYADDYAVQNGYKVLPFLEAYDENGNVIHQPGTTATLGNIMNLTDTRNPLDLMKSTEKKRETWRLLGNIYLEFKPLKGLSYKTTFSPNYNYYREGYYAGKKNPVNGQYYNDDSKNGFSSKADTWAYYATNRGFSWTWDNVVNYNTTIKEDHSINLMALYSNQKSTTEYNRSTANDIEEGTLWWNLPSGTYVNYQSSGSKDYQKNGSRNYYSENSMTSWAFRANYGYKNRYLLTATVRWDGSSKFAKGNRWGCFPSVALAWRITEEPWMKKYENISNLKLRLSYGVTGNCDGIDNYASATSTKTGSKYYYNNNVATGVLLNKIIDPDLKWEKSHEWNLGLDFGFWNNRLNGSVDIYQKTSKDLLYDVIMPLAGYSVTTNIGEVRNRGIEIAINGDIIRKKDFRWSAGLTFASNKNEVKKINGSSDRVISSDITTGSLFLGSSVNNIYGFTYDGIVSDRMMTIPAAASDAMKQKYAENGFTEGQQIKEYDYYYGIYKWVEGNPILTDRNQDGQITDDDRKIIDTDPSFTAGLNTNVEWKNWDFGMSFYAKVGYKVYSDFLSEFLNYSQRAQQRINMDYYIPAGTIIGCDGVNADGTYINPVYQTATHYGEYAFVDYERNPNATQYNNAISIENANFLKCKNITLGYTFPKKWLTPWGCQHLRLYFTVTDPFCISKFKGFDPEWGNASKKNDGPSTVTYQIGASIKF